MKATIAASAPFEPVRGKSLRFKRLTVVLLFSWLPAVAVAEEVDTSALDAPQFSLGMVGFIGRISDAEKRMLEVEKALKQAGSSPQSLRTKGGAVWPGCMRHAG